jgi:3-methyl-2-oxobutanoate hydroxymethyltransferase
VQGKDDESAQAILDDAVAMQKAGADALLLECVPAALGKQVAEELTIPVIGIGAGADCDAQVLVLYDMLGITPGKRPKFSKDFLQGAGDVRSAVRAYVAAVKSAQFPASEHTF